MKIDDLIESPLSKYGMGNPMGLANKIGTSLKTLVPGGTGDRAKGELETGKVANAWKKKYMQYLGNVGGPKYGSTETLAAFLKKVLGFTDDEVKKVIPESKSVYEAALGVGQIDDLMLRAAQVAAANGADLPEPEKPNPTAPREPGMIDKAVDAGKASMPHIKKFGQQALDLGKKVLSKQPIKQKIDPTMGQPVPRNMPQLTKPAQPSSIPTKAGPTKFEPARQAPKMKMKSKPTYGEPLQVPTSEPIRKFEPNRPAPKMKMKTKPRFE